MATYILTKFGADWSIFLDVLECKFSNSRADNSDSSGPISSITELIRALVVIYILTKFGDDWLIFVDSRVLTSKLWMDGQMARCQTDGLTDGQTDGQQRTVSDHNSSLSTLCSGKLKIESSCSF